MIDIDWREIFRLRCKCKQGTRLTQEEQQLIAKAFHTDPERYKAMNEEVFEATKPFGSTT